MTIEEKLSLIFSNEAIAKEKREQNKGLKEEILNEMLRKGETELVVDIPWRDAPIILKVKPTTSTRIDKQGIADEVGLEKGDLKTALDFVELTQNGTLTIRVVEKHTSSKIDQKLKIRKKKPKKGKKN